MQTFGKQYLRLLLVVVWRLACYSFMDTGRGLNTSESETKDVIYFEAVSIWSFIITLPPPPRQIPSMGSKKRSTGKWYTCCGFTLHIRYNQYGESIGFMVSHKQACPLYVANKTLGNGWMSSS